MTSERDTERLLDEWLSDGPTVATDRVIDSVADRIGRQSQRPAWLISWRESPVNSYLKPILAAAAVIVVVVAGIAILGGPSVFNVGGPPSPSPSPSPAPPATASAAGYIPAMPDGTLSPGTYRLWPLASAPDLHIDATVPPGWQGFGSWAIPGPNYTGAPAGIGIGFIAADGIYSDPCHWDRAGNGAWPQPGIEVGPTVDDLVNALKANAAYTSTSPVDITLGGYQGKRVDLQLPADISGCDVPSDDTEGRYFVFSGRDAGNYAQGPSNRVQVWIVDAGGIRLIALVGDYAATPAADRAAAQGIVDSLVVTP